MMKAGLKSLKVDNMRMDSDGLKTAPAGQARRYKCRGMNMLNREYQHKILRELQEYYPEEMEIDIIDPDDHEYKQANIFYLAEHGLIERTNFIEEFRQPTKITHAKMTAKGLDFMAGDGGLSEILNKVTVRFDVDNLKEIIKNKIISLDLPEEKKKTALDKLKSFSGDVLKNLIVKFIEKGIENPSQVGAFIDLIA